MNILKKINFLFHGIVFDYIFSMLRFLYSLTTREKNGKVLIISLNYLGDVFMATPAINALKKVHPEFKIDVLIKKGNSQVIEHNPQINDIYYDCTGYNKISNTPLSFIKTVRVNFSLYRALVRENYDFIFDFTGSFESAFICGLAGRKKRYGISWRPHFRNAFDDVVDGYGKTQHLRNINCDVVRKAGFVLSSEDCQYYLNIQKEIDDWAKGITGSFKTEYVITIAPFAGWKQKEWDISNFLALSEKLSLINATILIIGSKSEAERLRPFENRFNDRILDYCGKTSLMHSAALLKYSDLFIGLDSSQSHLADALHTPSIVIFGPTNPKFHQIENNPLVKILYKQFDCSCHDNQKYCHENCFTFTCPQNHRCMRTINVDEVYDAAVDFLRHDSSVLNEESKKAF